MECRYSDPLFLCVHIKEIMTKISHANENLKDLLVDLAANIFVNIS